MKKILILLGLLITYSNIFAFLTQANWRWRNDDGNEKTATWKAAQNTPISLNSSSEVIRLRLEVYNNQTGAPIGVLDTLQYATSTSGPWTNIDTLAGSRAFMISASAFVAQDNPTTSQLTGVALTFAPGKIMTDSMVLKHYNLASQQHTEFEWSITGTPNTAPTTTYYFREWGSTANPLDIGVTYPSLTTAAVLPIKLTSFTATREKEKVRIEWTTGSEQNNDRFEILRSSDAKTWKTIASVKGKGTTGATSTYQVYDDRPLSGGNYFVIKQYDKDGRFYQSGVKFVKMPQTKAIISVYPNPSYSEINFSLANTGASDVEATLTNINGSVLHREIFKSIPANSINKLNLTHQPPAGVYILKLNAEGLSETVRVIIE